MLQRWTEWLCAQVSHYQDHYLMILPIDPDNNYHHYDCMMTIISSSGCSTPWSTCASAVSMLHRLSLPSRFSLFPFRWLWLMKKLISKMNFCLNVAETSSKLFTDKLIWVLVCIISVVSFVTITNFKSTCLFHLCSKQFAPFPQDTCTHPPMVGIHWSLIWTSPDDVAILNCNRSIVLGCDLTKCISWIKEI